MQTKEIHVIYYVYVFQLLEGGFKVESWLSQQEEIDTIELGPIDTSLQLVKEWKLDHIKPDPEYAKTANRFAISESGAIGISCDESPSLSVMYPDTDKRPFVLSKEKTYRSATFTKISGKEYLAAAGYEDGCLYFWDIESKTPRKVFDPQIPLDKRDKEMVMCKIDDNTIGYAEVCASLDESKRLFILKTDTAEDWTLSGTLKLFTLEEIYDMCHAEMLDGTSCLLLCVPYEYRIMAVGMEDGKTRWKAGKEEMGEKFQPWSICIDQNNCAYVADYFQRKIHLLSASDGTVIKRFDLGNYYGMLSIFTVRFHNQHLYVERKIHTEKVKKYAITKFRQIKEM